MSPSTMSNPATETRSLSANELDEVSGGFICSQALVEPIMDLLRQDNQATTYEQRPEDALL